MTNSIVKSLFVNRANAINADIVKNRDAILLECLQFSQVIADAPIDSGKEKAGTDAIRDTIFADARFTWLYDDTGKANKKGISKPIMSPLMRKIREGMLFLADEDNAEMFIAWTETDGAKKSGVCDFANIKKAIKPKAEKVESDASDADTSDASETDSDLDVAEKRTKAEFLAWVYTQAKNEFGMDSLALAEYILGDEGMKIADKFIDAA